LAADRQIQLQAEASVVAYDNNGNLTGIAIIREQIILDPGGNSFKGTFTVDIVDLNSNPVFHAAGTVSAKRITVD
jgi:hypothetical protein